MIKFRTDSNNNPTAFTTDVAAEGGLILGKDYEQGDVFAVQGTTRYYTAKLLGDPIAITIKLINNATFYTKEGQSRWTYVGIPKFIWDILTVFQKTRVIKFMYEREGGTEMMPLFNTPTKYIGFGSSLAN